MSTRNIFLPYYIVLTDPARVKALQAQYPIGVNRAIANPQPPATATGGAVIEFNAPFVGYNEAVALATTGDHIWTPYYKDGSAGGKPFPIDVAAFNRHSGGFLGLGGTTLHYMWIGAFVYAGSLADPANVDTDAPTLVHAPLAQRRWIDGFEMRGAETRATTGLKPTYAAGRRTGGKGLKGFGAGSDSQAVATTIFGGSAGPQGVWTRFRMRWFRAGTGTNSFARWNATAGVNCNYTLSMSATGDVILSTTDDNSLTTNVIGTIFTATLKRWYAIDVLAEYNGSAVLGTGVGFRGRFRFYVDKTLVLDLLLPDEGTAGGNAGPGRRLKAHATFTYGNISVATTLLQLDFDDMVEADIPVGRNDGSTWDALANYVIGNTVLGSDDHVYKAILANGPGTVGAIDPASNAARATYWVVYEGLDWLNGSAVVRCKAKGFTVNNVFAGDYRGLNQPNAAATNRAVATSSTSGAICEADLDIDRTANVLKGVVGLASAIFGVNAFSAAIENATLSYDIGGGNVGAAVIALTNAAAGGSLQTMYRPAALTDPSVLATLRARFTHAASVNLNSVISMFAMVEMIGTFGSEDLRAAAYPDGVPTVVDGNALYQHNAPYWNAPWSWNAPGAAPGPAGVGIVGGTYVGNGTGQDITFRMPVHFYMVRPTSGTRSGGAKWISSAHYGHQDDDYGITAMHALGGEEDLTFVAASGDDAQQNRYMLRLSGGNQQSNALGVTYQYIAVSDPGGRYLMNHAAQGNISAIGQDDTLLLPNADFVAEWLWGIIEQEDNTTSTGMLYKSLAHAAATCGRIGAAAAASTISFLAAGQLRVQQALYTLASGNTADNIALSLWRRHDGNADAGEAKLWAFGSYIGDGTASRSVTCGTAGLRPLFAAVLGDDGSGAFRDPSHTTTDSELASGGGTGGATRITGGALDGFSVGLNLNTNAVLFHYFVIWGSATAGNGGWSINGEFNPVEAAPPADGPWPDDPDIADYDETPTTPTTSPLVDQPDIEADTNILTTAENIGGLLGGSPCETYTRSLVNIALSHLEISKVVGNLSTDTSEIAALARRHVKEDINAVLRAWPWDFATRYANLVLVAGSETAPVNNDWTYSYRGPSSMITARRISKLYAGRTFDPTPVPFRLGQDASGLLVYCNTLATATVPLSLEYTYRNDCPAFWGDPLFREALTWKFAASLSPLARDSKKKQFCLQMFRDIVGRGETVDANEQQQEPNGDADWITGRQ